MRYLGLETLLIQGISTLLKLDPGPAGPLHFHPLKNHCSLDFQVENVALKRSRNIHIHGTKKTQIGSLVLSGSWTSFWSIFLMEIWGALT